MIEVALNKLSKSYGSKEVLKNINFEIKSNEKVALIGENGCGKSTILKLICGEDKPTTGDVFTRKDASIGMLSQQPKVELNDKTVREILYSSFEKINKLKDSLLKTEAQMLGESGERLEKVIIKYSRLQEEFTTAGGYEVDSRIDKISSAFKITSLMESKYKNLSGGEKTIVNLIYILLQEPDILLLDEPTNHLDINMLEWLEKFIKNYKKTVIVVSHDRYFLDNVVNKIILITGGETEIFYGNYSYYLKENENRIMQQFNDYKNQQKQIEAMKKAIKKLREFGKLAYPCGENFFKRAASIEKRLEKIEILDKPKKENKIALDFNVESRSGNDIIELNKFCLSIGDKELLKNASLFVKYQERVCIMGANGAGKSTFIKAILNKTNGIKIGSNVKIGFIPQEIIFDDENKSVLEESSKYFIGPEENLRSALNKFLFYSEGVFVKVKNLSGGERLRLKLFCLMQQDNNLLILDEPTNHIDISTKEVLEDALKNYKGTLIVISHDRYFINKIATRIVYIEDKKLVSYIGNYDDYKNFKKTKK